MILRTACAADAPAIAAIWNVSIAGSLATFTTVLWSEDGIAGMIAERGEIFVVAEADDGIAGFATAHPFRPGPGYRQTFEHSIYIAEGHQGHGLGWRLLEALEIRARAAGVRVLIAGLSSANPGALRFHERAGFSLAGRLHEVGQKDGHWLDLIFMEKALQR